MNHLPNLLIVDDIKENLVILENFIRHSGVHIHSALSGMEALEKTRGMELALAIIDVCMPEMDGYQVAQKLNEERGANKVPIIFLTALDADELEMLKGYDSGAVDYLLKPVDHHILISKIGVFIDLYNQKKTLQETAAELKRSTGELARLSADLKISEEKYRGYIDHAPDGVFITDETGKYIEVNEAACQITGYTKEELLQLSVMDLVPEASLPDAGDHFRKVVETGRAIADVMFMPKTGSAHWWTVNAVKLNDKRFIGFTRDISSRKMLEESLRTYQIELEMQNEELSRAKEVADTASAKYTDLYEFAPSGYFTLSADKHILELNLSGARMLGIDRSRAKNTRFTSYLTSETRPVFDAFAGRIVKERTKASCEVETGHGSTPPVCLHIEGMVIAGGNQYLLNTADITEHKKTEEILKVSQSNLAEAQRIARLGSWDHDLVGNTVSWSDEMFCVYDLSPGEFDGNPSSLVRVVHPEDVEIFLKSVDNHLTTGDPLLVEYRIIHKDGSVHNVFSEGRIIRSMTGKPVRSVGIVQDITERKIMIEQQTALQQMHQLSKYNEKIRENERMSIARELHDDLGQSLTAVKIDLGFIRQEVTSAEVVTKINNLSALVTDTIKTVQRLTSQLRPEIIDDLGLTAGIEWYTKEFAQRCGVEVVTSLVSGLTISTGVSLVIFRIMQESLTNIARHSMATRVDIALRKTANVISFTIADNGVGIHEKEIQSKKSFGLLGMKERAASLGGTFDIRRRAEGGTVITFILPLLNNGTYENFNL